ncbi:phosphotransferase [Propioniciclava tarda]|uniref:Aminoglycoside phosphotransferase domain-containing protein n=1 Tax=Propioniciclava tarda TaxID=433330 RepID=A0A4Q9KMQ6_PROTD|nr:phosphotransferase [Propioniciclava tarda]TBT95515.1 hypothetical protein ET996_05320 [Propioniciclava tarda]SMO50462.1 Phosphotransferase enzyme family protein [Propioniciclava tarda]HQD60873.1 phosphotransferase [Propioniciclava tarda]
MVEPVEKQLKGGNTTPVARLGEQVLRESGPWTATVQKLLTHLRDQGIDWCPEPQGWHADGRESLTYLKGKVPTYPLPDWVYDEAVLTTAATWLRQLHDATVGFDAPAHVWRAARHQPAEVVCHNDFAPYNFVFRDRQLVGVIDWDFASPGPRLWDLAYLAYRLVPLMGPDNPDAPTASYNLMGRLRLLRDTYGSDASTQDILRMVVTRLDDLADFTRGQSKSTGNTELLDHVRGYETDAAFLRTLVS